MIESYLGIDIGFSKARRTTGLCLLALNRDCLELICRKTGSDKPQRRKDLRERIPKGADTSTVGIDGPLAQGNRVLMVIFRIMLMLPDSIKLERATDHGGITSRIDPGSFR